MLSDKEVSNLNSVSKEVRKQILKMGYEAQSAHIGGALSCVEILTVLYFKVMNVYPKNANNPQRDRLIFSKAHDAKALYAVLAERGFFPKKILQGYESDGGLLPGHSTRNCVPGVEVSAGSLGHGLPIAAGMAYVGKHDKKKYKIYTVISDGECDEGSTWEAALFAAQHALSNLVVIIDYNKLQGFGRIKDVLGLEPLVKKWGSFGWEVKEVDGHNMNKLIKVLQNTPFIRNKPSIIIAHTIKGVGGVKKHIDNVSSQYKPPTKEEYDELINNLS